MSILIFSKKTLTFLGKMQLDVWLPLQSQVQFSLFWVSSCFLKYTIKTMGQTMDRQSCRKHFYKHCSNTIFLTLEVASAINSLPSAVKLSWVVNLLWLHELCLLLCSRPETTLEDLQALHYFNWPTWCIAKVALYWQCPLFRLPWWRTIFLFLYQLSVISKYCEA